MGLIREIGLANCQNYLNIRHFWGRGGLIFTEVVLEGFLSPVGDLYTEFRRIYTRHRPMFTFCEVSRQKFAPVGTGSGFHGDGMRSLLPGKLRIQCFVGREGFSAMRRSWKSGENCA